MKYKCILADPPWYERGGGKIKRGADRHYPLMKTSEIIKLSDMVQTLADDSCHLYLWTTNNFLKDALTVSDTWGFRYITMITWAKDRIGLGQYFRGQTEHCLFCVRGKLPAVDKSTTLLIAPRRKHSEKPDQMYNIIETVSPGPRIELFARTKREGWDSWGNELPNTVQKTFGRLTE